MAVISLCMLLRKGRRFGTGFTAVLACIAMLVFALVPAGTHALSLHSPAFAVTDDGHSHNHGDHSHDDALEFAVDSSDTPDHHHADHTHEKAGLVTVAGESIKAGGLIFVITTHSGAFPAHGNGYRRCS